MKKQLIILFSLLAVLALLSGGVAALLLTEGAEAPAGESSPEAENTEITLVERETAELVSVESSSGLYAIYDPESEEAVIPALSGLPLDESALEELLRCCVSVAAQREITGGELSDYGLNDGSPTVTISYSDGSAALLKIGSSVPGASVPSSYLLFEGGVYVVYDSDIGCFTAGPEEFISSRITPASYDSESGAYTYKATGFSLGVPGGEFSVSEADAALPRGQFYTEYLVSVSGEGAFPGDEAAFYNLAESLFGMEGEVAAFAPLGEELDLGAFGLGEGAYFASLCAVSFTDEGQSLDFSLLTSAPMDGKIYFHVPSSGVVYSVSEDSAPLWYGAKASDLFAGKVFVPPLEQISKLTLEASECTVVFGASRDEAALGVDALKTEGSENVSALISSDDFSKLIDLLSESLRLGSAGETEDASPALKITVEYKDGEKETLELFESLAGDLCAAVNGGDIWLLPGDYAEKLLGAALAFF